MTRPHPVLSLSPDKGVEAEHTSVSGLFQRSVPSPGPAPACPRDHSFTTNLTSGKAGPPTPLFFFFKES